MKRLGDVCKIVMGQSPESKYYNENYEGLPFHQGVTNFGKRFPENRTYCTVTNRLAEEGDILFSVRAPVGRINLARTKMVIGRGLCSIRSLTNSQRFIFQQLTEKFQEEDIIGGRTIFKAVTKGEMHGVQILMPDVKTLSTIEDHLIPVFRQLEILSGQNINLRQQRDLLLPRLVSGELDECLIITNLNDKEV